MVLFFFQAEDGIRDLYVTGVQTCALPICLTFCYAISRNRWWTASGFRGLIVAVILIVDDFEDGARALCMLLTQIGRASCRERGWSLGGSGWAKTNIGRAVRCG